MTADELFEAALERRSLTYRIDENGLYLVQIGDVTATVNLDNIRRDYERDNDTGAVERFAQQLDGDVFRDPSWDDVTPLLRYSLEPADYAKGFDDTLHETVTDSLVKVFAFASPDGSRISWITPGMISDWGVSKEDVAVLANQNMDQLVRATKLEVLEAGEVELGTLSLEETHFKASLILSPQFRSLVSAVHDWPVFVVAPARDFVYVLAKEHRGFLGRLGGVVLREFSESGYPVTAEVLEVSDSGIVPIGSFAQKKEKS